LYCNIHIVNLHFIIAEDPRRPLFPYPPISGPVCSRWYPNTAAHRYGRKPLWSILDEIQNDEVIGVTTHGSFNFFKFNFLLKTKYRLFISAIFLMLQIKNGL